MSAGAGRSSRISSPACRKGTEKQRTEERAHRPRGMSGADTVHRSFSVDSPASASTTETIQKRITICGSVQPSCSK